MQIWNNFIDVTNNHICTLVQNRSTTLLCKTPNVSTYDKNVMKR